MLALLVPFALGLFAAPAPAPAAATPAVAAPAKTETAIFAGGCFWCMEEAFDETKGVVHAISGFTGGRVANPTYEQVSGGGTGHVESVQVEFDPSVVSYDQLLDVFWHNVDPTNDEGQFCDDGPQYTSEIFYANDAQKAAAEASKTKIEKTKTFKAPIVTKLTQASTFWPAEDYHQQYWKKNPVRYRWYRQGCGRDARLKQLWGKSPSE